MLVVKPDLKIPLWEFEFSFARGSGPGGQNVNKVNSKAVLRWNIVKSGHIPDAVRARFLAKFPTRVTSEGFIVLASDRHRDQGRNVAECLERLRAMLLEAARPVKKRKKTKPTKGSREDRLSTKKKHGQKKKNRGRIGDW
jgi:ribosome-associated protein